MLRKAHILVIILIAIVLWQQRINFSYHQDAKSMNEEYRHFHAGAIIAPNAHNIIPVEPAKANKRLRVAVLIHAFGPSLPVWFDMFALQAELSAELFDWYVFVDEAKFVRVPRNVKLVRMSYDQLCERLAKVNLNAAVNQETDTSTALKSLLQIKAHYLTEFSPLFGIAFDDILENYSHWAYSELDILPGRISRLIQSNVLQLHDIVTLSFGDNFRIYLRSQMTIHKNNQCVNRLWEQCMELSAIKERLQMFVANGQWKFQSPEGCYSRAVAKQNRISFLISSSQISDAFYKVSSNAESLLIGSALLKCGNRPLYDTETITSLYSMNNQTVNYQTNWLVNQTVSGIRSVMQRGKECSFWLDREYQMCIDSVPEDADIISKDRSIYYRVNRGQYVVNDACREHSLFHLQTWKHSYYSFVTRIPPFDANALVITEFGFLPLRIDNVKGFRFGDMYRTDRPYNQLHLADLRGMQLKLGERKPIERFRNFQPHESIALSYCAGFSSDVKTCVCPVTSDNIEVVQRVPVTVGEDDRPITLISAAWAKDFYDRKYDMLLDSWNGPKLFVLAVSSDDSSFSRNAHWTPYRSDVTIVEVTLGSCASTMPPSASAQSPSSTAFPHSTTPSTQLLVPDKMLFNIGLDLSETDLVCVSPPSVVFRTYRDVIDGAINRKNYTSNKFVTEKLALQMDQIEFSTSEVPAILLGSYMLYTDMTPIERVVLGALKFKNDPDLTADKSSFSNDRGLYPYPPVLSTCGPQQYDRLQLNMDERLKLRDLPFPPQVECNAMEYMRELTEFIPIVFRKSQNRHGTGFVRFPEEFNGPGCYGLSILRILYGSGYSVYWAHELFVELVGKDSDERQKRSCGCANRRDKTSLETFATTLNMYYLRAVELRKSGVTSVYSQEHSRHRSRNNNNNNNKGNEH